MIVVFNTFPQTGIQTQPFFTLVGRAASAAAEVANEVMWLTVYDT